MYFVFLYFYKNEINITNNNNKKKLSLEDYLDMIRPFLRDMTNNHRTHGEWKIQLTMQITFISSLDTGEFRIMNSKSDNVEVMMGIEIDDIINKLFKSFFKKYQEGFEKK